MTDRILLEDGTSLLLMEDGASAFLLEASGGPTVSTVTTAVVAHTPQIVIGNARKRSAVTNAASTLTPQTVIGNARTRTAVVNAAATLNPQTVIGNARKRSAVTTGTAMLSPQPVIGNARKRSAVLAGSVVLTGGVLVTILGAGTVSAVVVAVIQATTGTLSTQVVKTTTTLAALVQALARTVRSRGAGVMQRLEGNAAILRDASDHIRDAVGFAVSTNLNPAGYWFELALAAEELAVFTQPSATNGNIAGYILRAARAMESLAGTDPSLFNDNQRGTIARLTVAAETYTATGSVGSLLLRLRAAMYAL